MKEPTPDDISGATADRVALIELYRAVIKLQHLVCLALGLIGLQFLMLWFLWLRP